MSTVLSAYRSEKLNKIKKNKKKRFFLGFWGPVVAWKSNSTRYSEFFDKVR